MAKAVKFAGGNACLDMGCDEVEHFGGQFAGNAHAFDIVCGFDGNRRHREPEIAEGQRK